MIFGKLFCIDFVFGSRLDGLVISALGSNYDKIIIRMISFPVAVHPFWFSSSVSIHYKVSVYILLDKKSQWSIWGAGGAEAVGISGAAGRYFQCIVPSLNKWNFTSGFCVFRSVRLFMSCSIIYLCMACDGWTTANIYACILCSTRTHL